MKRERKYKTLSLHHTGKHEIYPMTSENTRVIVTSHGKTRDLSHDERKYKSYRYITRENTRFILTYFGKSTREKHPKQKMNIFHILVFKKKSMILSDC